MISRISVALLGVALASQVVLAQEWPAALNAPPPRFIIVRSVDPAKGEVVFDLQGVAQMAHGQTGKKPANVPQEEGFKVSLQKAKWHSTAGKEVGADVAVHHLKPGVMVLLSADGNAVDRAYLSRFKEDNLVLLVPAEELPGPNLTSDGRISGNLNNTFLWHPHSGGNVALNTATNTYADFLQQFNELAIEVRDPQEELLGATLASLSDALRAQLNVPAGQGILVASTRSDGPSAQAGLKPYDVLLMLAEKPLATAEDFSKLLKAAGEAPVSLKLLRAGKQVTLQVRPVYRVTLGPVPEEKKEYYLGISLGGLDEALRSQIGLSAGHKGVIITDVIKDTPAEKVGLQTHDIVLEYGGMHIDTPEKLAAQVQAGQEKPQAIRLLRAGKPLNISIQAAIRNAQSSQLSNAMSNYIRVLAIRRAEKADRSAAENAKSDEEQLRKALSAQRNLQDATEAASLRKIEDLQIQVHSLQQTVEELKMMLKSTKAPKTGNP